MILTRKTPGRKRAKQIASTDNRSPYFRWDKGQQHYDFCFEMFNGATGETFEVSATQLEWQDVFDKMLIKFSEAPGS